MVLSVLCVHYSCIAENSTEGWPGFLRAVLQRLPEMSSLRGLPGLPLAHLLPQGRSPGDVNLNIWWPDPGVQKERSWPLDGSRMRQLVPTSRPTDRVYRMPGVPRPFCGKGQQAQLATGNLTNTISCKLPQDKQSLSRRSK